MSETLNSTGSEPSIDPTSTTQAPIQAPIEQNAAPQVSAAPEAPTLNADTAGSSPAGDTDANKKISLLDVIKNASEGKSDMASSTMEDQKVSAQGSAADDQGLDSSGQKKAPDAQELPFHKHPRWQEMVAERESLKPKAEQFEKINTFMNNNGLTPQEMAEGMYVMALMKNNPVEAHQRLNGYVQNLARFTGDVLSPELQSRVDEALIDKESAKELARLHAERDFMMARQAQAYQRSQQEQEYIQQQEIVAQSQSMVNAVSQWEQVERSRDPEWSAKYEMVQDRVKALLAERPASNPSEAIEIARRALSDVNARLRPLAGRNTPLKVSTSSMSSVNASPAPRSLADVIRLGFQS